MKPWETHIVDSFQYWRFGDYKHFTSLDLLAAVLQVPSSKGDMDGSMVGRSTGKKAQTFIVPAIWSGSSAIVRKMWSQRGISSSGWQVCLSCIRMIF